MSTSALTSAQHHELTSFNNLGAGSCRLFFEFAILCASIKNDPLWLQAQDIIHPLGLTPGPNVQGNGIHFVYPGFLTNVKNGFTQYFSLPYSDRHDLVTMFSKHFGGEMCVPGLIGGGSDNHRLLHR